MVKTLPFQCLEELRSYMAEPKNILKILKIHNGTEDRQIKTSKEKKHKLAEAKAYTNKIISSFIK